MWITQCAQKKASQPIIVKKIQFVWLVQAHSFDPAVSVARDTIFFTSKGSPAATHRVPPSEAHPHPARHGLLCHDQGCMSGSVCNGKIIFLTWKFFTPDFIFKSHGRVFFLLLMWSCFSILSAKQFMSNQQFSTHTPKNEFLGLDAIHASSHWLMNSLDNLNSKWE